MKYTVTQAGADHLAILVPLFDAYRVFYGQDSDTVSAREFLSDRIANEDSALFVAIDDKECSGLGFAQLYPSFSSVGMKRVWILNDLFVADVARRSGVARKLMDAVSEFAKSTGACRIDLATVKDNLAAKTLYEAIGYGVDTQFDHYKLPIS